MAPLAERFVRVRADTKGFAAELRKGTTGPAVTKAGAQAGAEWATAFTRVVKTQLSQLDLKVKVKAVVDMSAVKQAAKQAPAYLKDSEYLPNYLSPSHGQPTPRSRPRPRPSAQDTPSDAPAPPKVPVELDPLVRQFQAEVRRQVAALSKDVSAKIPVTPETAGLREDIADKLRVVERQLKVKIPAGAEARGFETDLRALVREVESQIRVSLPVEPEADESKAASAGRRAAEAAKRAAQGVKAQIQVDPLVTQFQANVRRELAGLTRTAVKIPVTPETAGLRRDVALRIAAIERGLKIKVPVGADGGSLVTGLTGQLGGLKGILGGALGLAPQALQAVSGGFDAVSGSATKAAGGAAQLGGSLQSLAGPIGTALTIGLVALAISALPAIALAATGAVFALGGALASLPALGVGLGAIVGTLGLGFQGLGDHLKTAAKAGGGATKSLSSLHSAQRAVTQAQRELLKSSKDLDKARADEIERIDDLGRSLRGAVLDEEDAAVGVAQARQKLAEARGTGDINAIGEADRAYRRSLLTLDEARDKTGDLKDEKAKADKDGVEGSDQVQTALEHQRDATERLQAANESLAEAQKSMGASGASAAKKLMKIAPAAQEVVDKLKQLKPALEEVRLAVQQELFQGVAPELQRLADAWKQPLKSTLVSYAGTINGLFKNLGASVRNPEFIGNITSAAETFRVNFDKIGTAVSGPLVDAFGRLARAAKPFIDVLGDKIAGLVTHFSDWIKSADDSGKLTKFMEDAAYYFGQLWDIGGNLLGIVGDLFGILFDTKSQGGAKDYLSGLNEELETVRDWLKDPENQKKIKEWIEDFGKFVKNMQELTQFVLEKVLPALSALMGWIGLVKNKIDEWRERWKLLKDTLSSPINFGGIFDSLKEAFRGAINWVIGKWNSLSFTIPGITFLGFTSPGRTISPPQIKPFAAGGVVQARPGGVIGQIGEAGQDEAVAPVDVLKSYITDAVVAAVGSNAGSASNIIEVKIYIDSRELKQTVVETIVSNPEPVARAAAAGAKKRAYAG